MQENKILSGGVHSSVHREKDEPLKEEVLVRRGELEELIPEPGRAGKQDFCFLSEVCLPISVELGRSRMKIKEILELNPGSVVQLDKLPEEPVELLVEGKPLARGEVVVVGDRLGVRITELIYPSEEK